MKVQALIVEDRNEVAGIWKAALEKLDMEVRVAASLADAKQMSNRIPPPDLILLDLTLLDSDRVQTITSIKDLKQGNNDVVVLVVSGFLTPELIQMAIHQGAHGAIEKIEVEKQADLWHAILRARDCANDKGQSALQSTSELIKRLTAALHFL